MSKTFPVQVNRDHPHVLTGRISEAVYMKVYSIYKQMYGEQKALIEGECRGGFGVGEIIGLLYASTFPRSEWHERMNEALQDMENI